MLDWVGMANIRQPMNIIEQSTTFAVQATLQVFVNLTVANTRGIHMSRLYLHTEELATLSAAKGKQLLKKCIISHAEISDTARISIAFLLPIKQPSLLSGNAGWRSYPVTINLTDGPAGGQCDISVKVAYSSTCPCSTALSQQLIADSFAATFGTATMVDPQQVIAWMRTEDQLAATPHSQRSYAHIKIRTSMDADWPIVAVIDCIEQSLQTRVQTAVKREDEQEFARINALNTMFCEDAARRIKLALNEQHYIEDYWLRVDHLESLHEHDAVAIASKGVVNGYRAEL